jgi:hypothetical protein
MGHDFRASAAIYGTQSEPIDNGVRQASVSKWADIAVPSGSGVGQADKFFEDEDTIASGATKTYDLAGGGLNALLGNVLTLANLVALAIESDVGNTTNLTVFAGSNPVPILVPTTATRVLLPGERLVMVRSGGDLAAVTAGTGDTLTIVNASGASAKVRVVLAGR